MKRLRNLLGSFVLISLLFSCASNKISVKDISGTYYAREKDNVLDYVLLRFRNLSDTLILKPDYSYIHEGCTKTEGRWELKGRKIYLYADSIRFRDDQFNNDPQYSKYLEFGKKHVKIIKVKRNKLFKWNGIKVIPFFPFFVNSIIVYIKDEEHKN